MTRNFNPYTPGAGIIPKYLAGRDNTLNQAIDILEAESNGYPQQPVIYYGLRGVGKTVLLNAIESKLEEEFNKKILYVHLEVSETKDFLDELFAHCIKITHRMSIAENIREKLEELKMLVHSLKVTYNAEEQSFTAGLSEEIQATGNLNVDLTDLFVKLGMIAKQAKRAICFFIDEIQYLRNDQAEALIQALHRVNQLRLSVTIFGAGLPKVLRSFGEAKSYSERLFQFIEIGSLDEAAARDAICKPADDFGVKFSDEAVAEILKRTNGYPYFIQELCRAVWGCTSGFHISKQGVIDAVPLFYEKLDSGFFKSRFDRCTRREQEFVFAMVRCGELPCTIANIAEQMHTNVKKISTYRAKLIDKGIIFSTAYGEVDFTVPQFDEYLKRIEPDKTQGTL